MRDFSIAFGSARVLVEVESRPTLDACRLVFTHMLGSERPDDVLVSTFRVRDRGKRFELYDKERNLVVNTARLLELQQHLKSEVTLELIRANSHFMWLHASGAVNRDQAVLITGVSGRGKSTLVSGLTQRGWKYVSDDMLPLDPATDRVLPFPSTAMRRLPPPTGEFLSPDCLGQLERTFVDMTASSVFAGSAPLAGIVIPEYCPDGMHRLRESKGFTAAAELLSGCINFIDHDRKAIRYFCGLMESLPVYEMTWNDPELAVQAIIERFS